MKTKLKYTDNPLGRLRVIEDFLLGPGELRGHKVEGVKVTMTLSKSSVAYFKKAAKKYGTPYQRIIRRLLDAYAARHRD